MRFFFLFFFWFTSLLTATMQNIYVWHENYLKTIKPFAGKLLLFEFFFIYFYCESSVNQNVWYACCVVQIGGMAQRLNEQYSFRFSFFFFVAKKYKKYIFAQSDLISNFVWYGPCPPSAFLCKFFFSLSLFFVGIHTTTLHTRNASNPK